MRARHLICSLFISEVTRCEMTLNDMKYLFQKNIGQDLQQLHLIGFHQSSPWGRRLINMELSLYNTSKEISLPFLGLKSSNFLQHFMWQGHICVTTKCDLDICLPPRSKGGKTCSLCMLSWICLPWLREMCAGICMLRRSSSSEENSPLRVGSLMSHPFPCSRGQLHWWNCRV